jgi:hypothetical protein
MKPNRKIVRFVAGLPVSGASVVGYTHFDGFQVTLLVDPKSRKVPMPGERWQVDICRRPLSIDRKEMKATARAWPMKKIEPLMPVARANPSGIVLTRSSGDAFVEVKPEPTPEWIRDLYGSEDRLSEVSRLQHSKRYRPQGLCYA